MHCMVFCFVRVPVFTYPPEPCQTTRAALDLQHDGVARCLWQIQRRGGMASKGAVGVGFSPDALRLLRSHPGE